MPIQTERFDSGLEVSSFDNLEPRVGVEPTTCRLRIGCSTTELPRPVENKGLIQDFYLPRCNIHQTFIVLFQSSQNAVRLSGQNAVVSAQRRNGHPATRFHDDPSLGRG